MEEEGEEGEGEERSDLMRICYLYLLRTLRELILKIVLRVQKTSWLIQLKSFEDRRVNQCSENKNKSILFNENHI